MEPQLHDALLVRMELNDFIDLVLTFRKGRARIELRVANSVKPLCYAIGQVFWMLVSSVEVSSGRRASLEIAQITGTGDAVYINEIKASESVLAITGIGPCAIVVTSEKDLLEGLRWRVIEDRTDS